MLEIVLLATAYIVGSIPFSLIIPKLLCKIDIRKIGSGNIGATNVYRACGIKIAILCFLLDGFKGFVAIIVASKLLNLGHEHQYLFAFAAILGHVYSIFLKFKGGKGVATSIFTILAIDPAITLLFAIIWVAVFYIKKISSLAALSAFFVLAIVGVCFQSFLGGGAATFYILLFIFVCFTHKTNIKRILEGTESKTKR